MSCSSRYRGHTSETKNVVLGFELMVDCETSNAKHQRRNGGAVRKHKAAQLDVKTMRMRACVHNSELPLAFMTGRGLRAVRRLQ